MLKLCRKYLQWQQNSVFEGEISQANFSKLQADIQKHIKPKTKDSVIIYILRTLKYSERIVIGEEKKQNIFFI